MKSKPTMPQSQEIEREIKRIRYNRAYRRSMMGTIGILVTIAAVAVLISTLVMPVLQIYGTSMDPLLTNGDIVISYKNATLEPKDIVAFYYNNRVLVKRVIAHGGEWVDIDAQGHVSVNGDVLDEPYVSEPALGECNLEFPYQVPDGRLFVLGDNRATSVDSRHTAVGCISEEQIVGKLIFRVWPMDRMGRLGLQASQE